MTRPGMAAMLRSCALDDLPTSRLETIRKTMAFNRLEPAQFYAALADIKAAQDNLRNDVYGVDRIINKVIGQIEEAAE